MFADGIMVSTERIGRDGCKWVLKSAQQRRHSKRSDIYIDNVEGIHTYNSEMMIISTHCLVSCRECHSHEGRYSREQTTVFNVKDIKHEDCDVNFYQLIHSCIKR